MPVSFPEAEDMTQVRRIGAVGSGDAGDARGSARDSWSRLKSHLNDGGPQLDPDTEDRVSRASTRASCGAHYRDSMRMSGRPSFVQLVSDLQEGSKPEGEAMKWVTFGHVFRPYVLNTCPFCRLYLTLPHFPEQVHHTPSEP